MIVNNPASNEYRLRYNLAEFLDAASLDPNSICL
jgi:hypothetical protein